MEEPKKEEIIAPSEAQSPEEAITGGWREFEKFYKQLLVGCALVLILGIVVAVLVSVSVGMVIFLGGCAIYLYFTRDELKRRLGLGYKRVLDGWAVIPRTEKTTEVLWIPEKLMGLPVTELSADEAAERSHLREIYLPESIRRLDEKIFEKLPNLEKVYYLGSEEQWNRVEGTELPEGCELVCLNQTNNPDQL